MSRLRLLLLIPTLDQSGAEKQLTLLATRLPRDEFDVHVVALTRGGPYEAVLREAGTAYACHSCRIVVVSSIPVFPPLRRPSATG